MANKRDTAQQKRARQNRAQREALAARSQGAPKRPSRVAPSTAEKLANKSAGTSSSSSSSAKGDTAAKGAAKPRKVRPVRPGDVPVDIDTLEGSWRQKVAHVPGGTQVIMAAMLTVVVVAIVSFMPTFVSEAAQKADKPKADQTIYEALGTGPAVVILGTAVLAVGAALAYALTPHRRKVWTLAAVVVAVAMVLGQLTLLLAVSGMLGFGAYKSFKVETGGASLLRRRSASDRDGTLDESTSVEDGGPA